MAGQLPEKADRRFEPAALAAISRVFAREAVLKVAEEGLRWVAGATQPGVARDLATVLPLGRVRVAQAGLLADMDQIGDALYGRTSRPSTVEGPSS
jgi:hypothetical protein